MLNESLVAEVGGGLCVTMGTWPVDHETSPGQPASLTVLTLSRRNIFVETDEKGEELSNMIDSFLFIMSKATWMY